MRALPISFALVTVYLTVAFAPGCSQEKVDVPNTGTGSATGASATPGGQGGAGGSAQSGGGGAGGGGGSEGVGGAGGGPAELPQCACLVDQNRTPACGACVSFATVDECNAAYAACQGDADCKAVDDCVLADACADGACLAACRELAPKASRNLYDEMTSCACGQCDAECDDGNACR